MGGMSNTSGAKFFGLKLQVLIPYLAFLIIFGFFAAMAFPRFVTYPNFTSVMQQAAVLAIVALGMHFVIVTGAIDLSVGSVLAVSGMLGASFAKSMGFAGLLLGIFVGAFAGMITGVVYTHMRVPSFITSLGMQMAARGFTVLYCHSDPISLKRDIVFIGKYPLILFITIGIFVVMFILYNLTSFGRYCVAVGGDEHICNLNGIPVKRVKVLVFVLAGALAGLGGILMAARLGAATPTVATGFEVSAISAVALGGTALSGGVGSIQNTLIGALTIAMLVNGLTILGVPSEMQTIITGCILVMATFISLDRKKVGIIK